jgi:hypothetical protein
LRRELGPDEPSRKLKEHRGKPKLPSWGNYNPLHIGARSLSHLPPSSLNASKQTPRCQCQWAPDAGFGGVILHSLPMFGSAARAILEAVGDGVPSSLRYFSVRRVYYTTETGVGSPLALAPGGLFACVKRGRWEVGEAARTNMKRVVVARETVNWPVERERPALSSLTHTNPIVSLSGHLPCPLFARPSDEPFQVYKGDQRSQISRMTEQDVHN